MRTEQSRCVSSVRGGGSVSGLGTTRFSAVAFNAGTFHLMETSSDSGGRGQPQRILLCGSPEWTQLPTVPEDGSRELQTRTLGSCCAANYLACEEVWHRGDSKVSQLRGHFL